MNAPDGKVFWLIASDTGVLLVLETPSPCSTSPKASSKEKSHTLFQGRGSFCSPLNSKGRKAELHIVLCCCVREPDRLTIRVLDDFLGVPHESGMLGSSVQVVAGGGFVSAG